MKDREISLNQKKDRNVLKVSSIDSYKRISGVSSDLIIEENTIYEIDKDCLDCLKKEKDMN
ncbi:hypothetical protein [[Clostridium] polysaccharolyticum]|uniref:Uncharacterized protein n=1 Tax=[Clostridium] polysaccharolyticum TaxID=29364 RepID=A0A1H9YN56_9FIRM|nr:hypothetical protein [[Clostridium] polysaccharolyticum]SES70580.1 hypothetical protein SAMN04487772_102117 [[Clostridium] polysaccharolyticum]